MIAALRKLNCPLLAAMLALMAVGTVAIWSAGGARPEAAFHGMWKANLTAAAVALVVYFALALVDYRRYLPVMAPAAYALAAVLLVLVLVVGSVRLGGRRWLWFFQPSEVAKLAVIAAIAQVFGSPTAAMRGFRGFLTAAALIAVPVVLILAEPDLGTALTLLPATLVMLVSAGVWRRGIVSLVAAGFLSALAVLGAVGAAERPGTSPERRERILAWVPLAEHQIRRVKVFLYPEEDPLRDGYNLRQAKISIGSGGFAGKGIGRGESNHLRYLPPAVSMNDFIFCVWAEETGYRGTLLILTLFATLTLAGGYVALRSQDGAGRLLALGVATLVFAHVFINLAMSIGIVPITGVPLPFISSGRTFLVTVTAALGIVQSVSVYGRKESS